MEESLSCTWKRKKCIFRFSTNSIVVGRACARVSVCNPTVFNGTNRSKFDRKESQCRRKNIVAHWNKGENIFECHLKAIHRWRNRLIFFVAIFIFSETLQNGRKYIRSAGLAGCWMLTQFIYWCKFQKEKNKHVKLNPNRVQDRLGV